MFKKQTNNKTKPSHEQWDNVAPKYRWPCLVLVCCTRWVLKDNTVHKGRKELEAGEHICAPNHASNPPLSGKLHYETVTNSLKAHTSVISLEIVQKNCVLIIVPVGSISAV